MNWYPENKKELNNILSRFLQNPDLKIQKIHGLIVPHAGYIFSGKIAGKAFSLLKKTNKVIVVGPSHYSGFHGIKAIQKIETPLGKIKIMENNFEKIEYEHSVENQIPFLQKLNPEIQILPLVVGEIDNKKAEEIAEYLTKVDGVYIFSTDLSHFFPYEQAVRKDKETIKIIENLDLKNWKRIDACGIFSLLIMMHLCKMKGWKPHLIEYKNSGDIVGDKSQVVGYASFWF